MHLVGLDIGFSEKRRSNALAIWNDGTLTITKLSVAERDAGIAELTKVDVIAIDAPITAPDFPLDEPREVEHLFCRGAFQKRCKPGMSHIRGTGRTLREHGNRTAELMRRATRSADATFPQILPSHNIVEAFPNAFLGVALSDETYRSMSNVPRGGKFDWLYDSWVRRRLFRRAAQIAQLGEAIAMQAEEERDHDRRAAIVCLLTAAFAYRDQFTACGDDRGGWFFLPPLELWSEWAKRAIEETNYVAHGKRVAEPPPILSCRFPFPPQQPPVVMPEACSSKCPNCDAATLAHHASIPLDDATLRAAIRSFADWFYAPGQDLDQQIRYAADLYTRADMTGTCIPKTILFAHYKHLQWTSYGPTLQLSEAAHAALKGLQVESWPDGELAAGSTWDQMFFGYSMGYEA